MVGFSGGNKYLFPGVAGPRILNFFHWLGAVVTNPMIIGNKWTPVRQVVDRAGAMVTVTKLCFCMVVERQESGRSVRRARPRGLGRGQRPVPPAAHHLQGSPLHTILSCAPPMYDELWTGGKCMYKLEPVLADGGELIIYAPHIREICVTHGAKDPRRSATIAATISSSSGTSSSDYPWGVLAHSTHVRGLGTYENGVEQCRARVTLATAIPPETCRALNLGYRDPASIRVEDYADREEEGVLLVPKAGERLFRLRHPPAWAGGAE